MAIDKGIKTYRIDPYNMQAQLIEKDSIINLNSEDEKQGLYILINPEQSKIYIGESSSIYRRLKEHKNDKKKEWFKKAFIITSSAFNKSLLLYFENQMIEADTLVKTSDWKDISNKNSGKVSEKPDESDYIEIKSRKNFEDVIEKYMTIFDSTFDESKQDEKINKIISEDEIFTLITNKGKYSGEIFVNNDNKFVLKKGSKFNANPSEKSLPSGYIKKINDIKSNAKFSKKVDEDVYELLENFEWNTPSFLADLITGLSCNGWNSFVKDGVSLGEHYREHFNKIKDLKN